MLQYSTTHRTNDMTDVVTQAGSTPYLLIYTGAPPASCADAATGTLIDSLPCSTTFGTVASGVLTAGAITATATGAAGTPGYWRLCTSSAGTTCVAQGLCYPSTTLTTSAATASGNVLTFTATSPIVAGQTAGGTNIPAGAYVLDVTSTTVTLNQNVTSTGVASGATITFGGDLNIGVSGSIPAGTLISISSFVLTANGA